jgi:hypothetical protein
VKQKVEGLPPQDWQDISLSEAGWLSAFFFALFFSSVAFFLPTAKKKK